MFYCASTSYKECKFLEHKQFRWKSFVELYITFRGKLSLRSTCLVNKRVTLYTIVGNPHRRALHFYDPFGQDFRQGRSRCLTLPFHSSTRGPGRIWGRTSLAL